MYPGSSEELSSEDVHADLIFPSSKAPDDAPYVAINMVTTLDGRVSVDGKASPIGSHVDRLIMRNIRCAADVILVGAGTVRAEEMNLTVPDVLSEKRKARGLSEQPIGVILAGSSDLPLHRKVFRSKAQSVVVIAGGNAPGTTLREAAGLGVRILRTGGPGSPDPSEVLTLLKEHLNVRTVVLEGGPSVNGSFLSSGTVHEILLTLSPKIFRSKGNPLTLDASDGAYPDVTEFVLTSVHASLKEGELYLRYLRKHG